MSVGSDEIMVALRRVDDAGFAIMLKPRWENLRVWLNQGGKGWPPEGWEPGDARRRD